jgi:sialidase-1
MSDNSGGSMRQAQITGTRNLVFFVAAFTLGTAFTTPTLGDLSAPRESEVFVSGQGGCDTYRIPSLVVTTSGSLLAFCEGRKDGRSDAGNIDLLVRRSTDGGETWSDSAVIWDDGPNTCGNPCAVVERETGAIWLLMTWNAGDIPEPRIQSGFGSASRLVFVTHSSDDGKTWSAPREITSNVKEPAWSWYATGPGAGIQLERSTHRGRLVIPCDHKIPSDSGDRFRSHVIYSDDRGQTWNLGGSAPADQVNECEAVELADGSLMLNMRNYDRSVPARQVCVSDDGGSTWRDQRHDATLIEPICQASLRRHRWPDGDLPGVTLFANPASTTARENLTIRASYDDGLTWPHARTLYAGSAAYCCLCVLPDGSIACLSERDDYRRIAFSRFALDWVESR